MKKFITFLSFLVLFFSVTLPAYAATVDPCNRNNTNNNVIVSTLCSKTGDDTGRLVGLGVQTLLVVAVVISVVFLIIGGLKWILSGGDKTKLDAARQQIVAAVVGLIVAFLAFFIINVLLGLFGLKLSDLTLPTFFTPSQ